MADQERETDELWVAPGHFYSPIPSLNEVRGDAERIFPPIVSELPGIDMQVDRQKRVFDQLVPFFADMDLPERAREGRRYFAANDFFSYCDAFFLSGLLRLFRPRRVVEIGSGFSSAVTLDANDIWLEGKLSSTFIEPDPERLSSLLTPEDLERVTLHRRRVQEIPLDVFTALESGDILFIDSSHVSKTGSDVNFLFFEVLPRLAEGVLVHVHDVPFPFEYDRSIVFEGRAWNEAYLLRAFLQFNTAFGVLFWPTAFGTHGEAIGRPLPERCRRGGSSSLWLVRGKPPK